MIDLHRVISINAIMINEDKIIHRDFQVIVKGRRK